MTIDPKRVQAVFLMALQLTEPASRWELLNRECGNDAALRQRVEALLSAHNDTGGFDIRQSGSALEATVDAPAVVRLGTLIASRYKLIENLGEGGMGTVWIAEQKEPVKRKVAIKLIKAGMDSKQVLARFDAERQALALMDHPNIAKVFDGGMTETGRPYFVMEYVKGMPFTEYCDSARLSLKERLELFIPVCQAVQHAHHKGIVHRDLKPSNILICLYDGKPVPKVIDFGLAKALHQQLTDQSLHTAHGMMVGTPLYMSPEQAEYNNLDVDTRTDVYSLGVVLYELLTGSTPLEREQLRKAAANEVLRLIREVEPPKPSTRLSGSASLPSIAAQRNIDPRSLQKSLAGDLDWIVMKALDKERTRRYETVNGFARDIERFLQEEPVEACPPSAVYRLKKYLRKHKPQVIAAGVILSALLISLAALSWGLRRANDAANTVRQSLADVTKERDAKTRALAAEANQRAFADAKRKEAEHFLTKGILRPIGFVDSDLNTAESQSFFEWASLTDNGLKVRILETALTDPERSILIARQGERAIQACVGTSRIRYCDVEQLLIGLQSPDNPNPQSQFAATWMAGTLGFADPESITTAIRYAISGTTDPLVRQELVAFIDDSLDDMMVNGKAAQIERLFSFLEETLATTTDQSQQRDACRVLAAMAARLDERQVERASKTLAALVNKTNERSNLGAAFTLLSALASRMEEGQLDDGWKTLKDIVDKKPRLGKEELNNCAASLKSRMSEVQFERSLAVLLENLRTTRDTENIRYLAILLAAMESRMNARQVEHAFATLAELNLNRSDLERNMFFEVGSAIASIASRLEAGQAGRAVEMLHRTGQKTTDPFAQFVVASGLKALAARLGDNQMQETQKTLCEILRNAADKDVMEAANDAIKALLAQPIELQTEYLLQTLIEHVGEADREVRLESALSTLAELGARMNAEQLERTLHTLLNCLSQSKSRNVNRVVLESLTVLAPKLDATQAERALNLVVESSMNNPLAYNYSLTWETLTRLAERMDETQAEQKVQTTIEIVYKSNDPDSLRTAGCMLAALTKRLGANQFEVSLQALTEAARKTIEENEEIAFFELGNVVCLLAPQLTEPQIERALSVLIAITEKSTDEDVLSRAAAAFAMLEPRLGDEQVNRALLALTEILRKARSSGTIIDADKGLATLAPRLRQDQVERTWEALLELPLKHGYRHGGGGPMEFVDIRAPGNSLLALAKQLDRARVHIEIENMFRVRLDRSMINQRHAEDAFLDDLLLQFDSPAILVFFLGHPGALGELRNCILRRLEEIALYECKPVFSELAASWPSSSAWDKMDEVSKAEWEGRKAALPPRKFLTVHDATEWLAKYRPEIDLEAPWIPEPVYGQERAK
ncbi:MAG: serine/threonine-protein kinase [Pirellulaceae bacterium]